MFVSIDIRVLSLSCSSIVALVPVAGGPAGGRAGGRVGG